jgi:hypothetical protein
MGYCARKDVYALGLTPEMFRRPARDVEGVTPSFGGLVLRSHGFTADTPIVLAVLSSSTLGAPAAAVPGGLTAGVVYYAQPESSDVFSLSMPGGSPIASFADSGSGIFGVIVDHGPYLDAAIDAATLVIDQYNRGHAAPIQAAVLTMVCAFLAARIYVSAHAALNPAFTEALDKPTFVSKLVDKLFEIWLTGAPIPGAVDATPDIAEEGPVLARLPGDFDLPQRCGMDVA